jgi:hypothetical protein
METYTAFVGHRRLATGSLAQVAIAVRDAGDALIFADSDGTQIDLDLRGSDAEIRARLEPSARGRGRPSLGVVAREVTLLPRHWEWLARQPGGASVALRKLVDAARNDGAEAKRAARDAAYRFMTALGGDLPGYEEAIRALFAGDAATFADRLSHWPVDMCDYALRLAGSPR